MKDFAIGGAVGAAILGVLLLLSTARAGEVLDRMTPWPKNVRVFKDLEHGVVCYYTEREWSRAHYAMVSGTLSCVKL